MTLTHCSRPGLVALVEPRDLPAARAEELGAESLGGTIEGGAPHGTRAAFLLQGMDDVVHLPVLLRSPLLKAQANTRVVSYSDRHPERKITCLLCRVSSIYQPV